jgi:hypothetical protein
MKRLLIILLFTFFIFNSSAQDSALSKFYFGANFAASTVNSDHSDFSVRGDHYGLGAALGVNMGYRVNENFGFTINYASSANSLNENNVKDLGLEISTLSVGPMFSMPFGDKIVWDFKPQISLITKGKQFGDYAENLTQTYTIGGENFVGSSTDKWTWSGGPTWVLGNSIVFDLGNGFGLSVDADYVLARFTEYEDPIIEDTIADIENGVNDIIGELGLEYKIDDYYGEFEIDYSSFRFGLGIRYNF